MSIIRWLLFIPIAAIIAFQCGVEIGRLFPHRSYSGEHLFLSIVSTRGLAPEVLQRFIPVTLFVLVGTMIAPSRGRKVVVLLGVLGGGIALPIDPTYLLGNGLPFYTAATVGTLLGCALGLLLAFQWQTKRRKEVPNHLTEPRSPSLGGSS